MSPPRRQQTSWRASSDPGSGAGRRRQVRPAAGAFRQLVEETSPQTLLARVQLAWPRAAGEAVAGRAEPVAERDGTVTIACRSATWAQELDLMQTPLLDRLNRELGEAPVEALRFTADRDRHGG